jgi:hypothetical protein
MIDDVIRFWLPALLLGVVPAAIAHDKRRPIAAWYLYGVGCVLVAWPLVAVPIVHALLSRPRAASNQDRDRQRRADALALIREPSLRSFPSRIVELRRRTPLDVDRRRYVYRFIKPGDALELVREPCHSRNQRAVAYHHLGTHLGYVPKNQGWVADALDDGLRFAVIVEEVKMSWLFLRRARSVSTRLLILYGGH